jgi:hypothetical protein
MLLAVTQGELPFYSRQLGFARGWKIPGPGASRQNNATEHNGLSV